MEFFLATCIPNLGEDDIAGSCIILDIYARCCVTCSVIILQTTSIIARRQFLL